MNHKDKPTVKISYQPRWINRWTGEEGKSTPNTECYTQTIKIPIELKEALIDELGLITEQGLDLFKKACLESFVKELESGKVETKGWYSTQVQTKNESNAPFECIKNFLLGEKHKGQIVMKQKIYLDRKTVILFV